MTTLYDGVFLDGHAPPTAWQRWKGATLTAPETMLTGWSLLTAVGLGRLNDLPTTVVRAGSGGPRLYVVEHAPVPPLRVSRMAIDPVDRGRWEDVAALAPARALLDVIAGCRPETADRLIREALRLRVVDAIELRAVIARHHGRRGVARMRALVHEYGALHLAAARSDPEALAQALLRAAGLPQPRINVVVAGGEADLVRPEEWLILELDGPSFHQFPTKDARKQLRWEQAGWVVRRLPTDVVYDESWRLLRAYGDPVTDEERQIAAATNSPAEIIDRWERGGRWYL